MVALTAGALVVLALVLSAAYPAPAQETSDMAMAGMAGMQRFGFERSLVQHGLVHRGQLRHRHGPVWT